MDEPTKPEQPVEATPEKRRPTWREVAKLRMAVWIVVGGLGIYFIAEGVIGLLVKSR